MKYVLCAYYKDLMGLTKIPHKTYKVCLYNLKNPSQKTL